MQHNLLDGVKVKAEADWEAMGERKEGRMGKPKRGGGRLYDNLRLIVVQQIAQCVDTTLSDKIRSHILALGQID